MAHDIIGIDCPRQIMCYYDTTAKCWTMSFVEFTNTKKRNDRQPVFETQYLLARQSDIKDIDPKNDHPLYKVKYQSTCLYVH